MRKILGSKTAVIYTSFFVWLMRSALAGMIATVSLSVLLIIVGWRPEPESLKTAVPLLLAFTTGVFIGVSVGHFLRDAELPPPTGES